MQRLTCPVEWKAADEGHGSLVGYASTFGNVDLGGDVVVPGAFAKSVEAINVGGIPLLADHDASTRSVLGTIYEAREDAKGLKIKARFASTQTAQDVRTLLLEGHLSKMSIGYEAEDYEYGTHGGRDVRLLKSLKLWETSVVVFPMNPEAIITGTKGHGDTLDPIEDASLALAVTAAEAWVRSARRVPTM